MRAEFLGQINVSTQALGLLRIELFALRRRNHQRGQRSVKRLGEIGCGPDHLHVARVGRDNGRDIFARVPAGIRAFLLGATRQPIGHATQRHLA